MPRDADGDRVAIDDRTLEAVLKLINAQEKLADTRGRIEALQHEARALVTLVEEAEDEVAGALNLRLDPRVR